MRMKRLPTANVDDGACSITGYAGPLEPRGKVVGSVSSAQPDLGAAPLKESREFRHGAVVSPAVVGAVALDSERIEQI